MESGSGNKERQRKGGGLGADRELVEDMNEMIIAEANQRCKLGRGKETLPLPPLSLPISLWSWTTGGQGGTHLSPDLFCTNGHIPTYPGGAACLYTRTHNVLLK